jgi:hypothetical protein
MAYLRWLNHKFYVFWTAADEPLLAVWPREPTPHLTLDEARELRDAIDRFLTDVAEDPR